MVLMVPVGRRSGCRALDLVSKVSMSSGVCA